MAMPRWGREYSEGRMPFGSGRAREGLKKSSAARQLLLHQAVTRPEAKRALQGGFLAHFPSFSSLSRELRAQ
jgi:hypothetical protein